MREIIYVRFKNINKESYANFLEICNSYTPLIEPTNTNSVFVDFTGCPNIKKIISNINTRINQFNNTMLIGWGTSKLIARLASEIIEEQDNMKSVINKSNYKLLRIMPGEESKFLNKLPLNKFYPLNQKMLKELKRIGFETIGDLMSLTPLKLSQILKHDGYYLYELIRGIDHSPVLGLYPPSSIIYPIYLENDNIDFYEIILHASSKLNDILVSRNSCCYVVTLEAETNNTKHLVERKLNTACYDTKHLANVIIGLWTKIPVRELPLNLKITLGNISLVTFSQPDLFNHHFFVNKEQKKLSLVKIIENLDFKYPGLINSGASISRREQILAIWDPWRR